MEGTKLNSRNTVRAKLKRTDYPARKAGRYEGGEETGSDWPAHFLLSGGACGAGQLSDISGYIRIRCFHRLRLRSLRDVLDYGQTKWVVV